MKVSIIGGGGLVGSTSAFALQTAGIVTDICLIDANKDMALGQAADLLHGAGWRSRIAPGDMASVSRKATSWCDGWPSRRKPARLINRNVDLFGLRWNKPTGFKEDGHLLVVSNPAMF